MASVWILATCVASCSTCMASVVSSYLRQLPPQCQHSFLGGGSSNDGDVDANDVFADGRDDDDGDDDDEHEEGEEEEEAALALAARAGTGCSEPTLS